LPTYSGNIGSTGANVIATQYGNSIGTTATYSSLVTAGNVITTNGVFWANGVAYSSGSSSSSLANVTLSGAITNLQPGVNQLNNFTPAGTTFTLPFANSTPAGTTVTVLPVDSGSATFNSFIVRGAGTDGIQGMNSTAGHYQVIGTGPTFFTLGNTGFWYYSNVSTTGSSTYGNTQVAAYLPTYSGNIGSAGANVIATQYGNSIGTTATYSSLITVGNVITTNGVFWANGVAYSSGSSSYGNTQVAAYLLGNITVGNITGTQYGNSIGTTATYSGNISAANIITTGATSGNISGANYVSANVFQVSTGIFWANGTAWSSSGGGTTYTSSGAGNVNISGSAINLTASGPGATSAGSSTAIPVVTTDAYGRVSTMTTAAVIAPAGTLSGTTLAATVVTSSLTSVGTLTSLAVTGNITAANIIANQYGNSIGTFATYSGNVTAANIVTTGTYGNITGANVISANTVSVTTYVRTQPVTFATLPAAASAGAGARAFITDGNTTTFGSQVSGGGANAVPVYSNGTNWYVG
jgi:hypothetical protein